MGVLIYVIRRARPEHPRRLRAGGGPGLHPGQRAAARCRVARTDRRRHEEGGSDPGEERGHRRLQHHLAATRCSRPPTRRTWASSSCSSSRGRSARPKRNTRTASCLALNRAFAQQIPEAGVIAFGPPSIPGLGTGAGFTMQLQDRSGGSPDYLAEQTRRFMEAARKRPEIGRINTLYRAAVPQVYRRHRPQQGAEVRRAAERRQHDARRAARQLVRQRFQPVRPRLQGVRAGGA